MTDATMTAPEQRLATAMRVFGGIFILATLIYAVGPFIGPLTDFCRRLPFVAFSVAKVVTLSLICIYASGSPRARRGLVWIAVGAHVVSVVAMLVVLAFRNPVDLAAVSSTGMTMTQTLWGAIALDGVICVIFVLFVIPAAQAAKEATAGLPQLAAEPLIAEESQLRALMVLVGVFFTIEGLVYLLGAVLPSTSAAFIELPFVTNSVVRCSALALIAFYVAGSLRSRIGLISIIISSLFVSIVTQMLFWLGAAAEPPMVLLGEVVPIQTALLVNSAQNVVVAIFLLLMMRRALSARYDPVFLSLRGCRTLAAMTDILVVGPDKVVAAEKVTENVDLYFSRLTSKRRIVDQMALFVVHFHPVLYLKPPFPEMDEAARTDHLKTHFYRDISLRIIPIFWRQWVEGLIHVAKQLTYVGYYNDPTTDPTIGYVRFEKRDRVVNGNLDITKRPVVLKVDTPADIQSLTLDADICIIGTGAGGSILARQFAKEGKSVVMLERGKFVQPAQFSDDEVEMIGKLYDDGIFQQTRDLRFTILQGSCVGGSTVVNNAVCFETPEPVAKNWNDPYKWNAGIDYAELIRGAHAIETLLSIRSQGDAARLNGTGQPFIAGAQKLGLPLQTAPVNANINGCLGCGYCNIGCPYGRKLSMLATVLPWTQHDCGDRLRILSECRVTKLIPGRNGTKGQRVDTVRAELPDGRVVTVRANKVVVSAGAIASSYLLQQSGIGKGLPVGQGMSFNMGTPLTADFDQRLDSFDGLQISHYGVPPAGRGWVYETWWNPPVAQALNMPGWFEQHYENMKRYPYLGAVGVLVGTESTGEVTNALLGGPDVLFEPSPGDRRKLADGLIELGQIFFAAGAKRVMLNSWNYFEFTSPNALGEILSIVQDPEELVLGTGHPQGGNALSQSPERGVVGPDFRVHGWENLFVCDASVIPSSLTVNPQLTIMSLAEYAAPRILSAQ